jgi:hypothetical protein
MFIFLFIILVFLSWSDILYALIWFVSILLVVSIVQLIAVFINTFSSKNSNYFLPNQLTFDEHVISHISPLGKGILKWEAFKSWKKIAGCYVLFPSRLTFIAVPQSTIAAQDITTFESLLRNNIKSKK